MGIVERRAIKAFQDQSLPALREALFAAAGFAFELEVAWDTLAHDDYAHLYDEAFRKVYFEPLREALTNIAVDDLGRDALRAGFSRVVVRDEGSSWPGFEAGVLTLPFHAISNLDDVGERRANIQRLLEKSL